MKRITQKKQTEVGLFTRATTGAYGDVSKAVAEVTWKNNQTIQTHPGGMGQIGIAGITQDANGASVSLTVTADNTAVKTLKAYLQGLAPASFVAWQSSNQLAAYIYANEKDPVSGKRYRSFFVCGAVFDGDGNQIASGGGSRQISGQALWAMEFEKAIHVDRFPGNATPVTALAPTKTTMIAWPTVAGGSRFALAILKEAADGSLTLLDPELGDYTETATGITLATGLAADEAVLVAYLYTDS